MKHWLHRWTTVKKEKFPGKGYFEHCTCKVCGVHVVFSHINFFASIRDAAELGAEIGFYKGTWNFFHPNNRIKEEEEW